MKHLIIFITMFAFSHYSVAGEGSHGGGPRIQQLRHLFIEAGNFEALDSLNVLLGETEEREISVNGIKFKPLKGLPYTEIDLSKSDLGVLLDLSKIDSIGTKHGSFDFSMFKTENFRPDEFPKILIKPNSDIEDIFTKDGELIIFNK